MIFLAHMICGVSYRKLFRHFSSFNFVLAIWTNTPLSGSPGHKWRPKCNATRSLCKTHLLTINKWRQSCFKRWKRRGLKGAFVIKTTVPKGFQFLRQKAGKTWSDLCLHSGCLDAGARSSNVLIPGKSHGFIRKAWFVVCWLYWTLG